MITTITIFVILIFLTLMALVLSIARLNSHLFMIVVHLLDKEEENNIIERVYKNHVQKN